MHHKFLHSILITLSLGLKYVSKPFLFNPKNNSTFDWFNEIYFRNNYIQLDGFYQELSYTKIEQQEAFSFISLLSEVGGFLGLLLGASILTVCELVDYVSHLIASKMKAGKAVKPKHNNVKS